ncbi:MAG: hypothetical protein QM639_04695 [Rhodocyclaceae bacterium]
MRAAHIMRWAVTPVALFTLAGTAIPAMDADEGLGRVFMTPQKRAVLDDMRARNTRIDPAAAATQQAKNDTLRLDGIVRRSDGKSVVWINGKSHFDRAPVASVGEHSARIFAGNGRSIDLRVGETVNLAPASTELTQ